MAKKTEPKKAAAKTEPKKKRRSNPAFDKILNKYIQPAYLWLMGRPNRTTMECNFRYWVQINITAEDAAKIRELRIANRRASPNPLWRRSGVKIMNEGIEAKITNGSSYCATKIKDLMLRGGYVKYEKGEYRNKPVTRLTAIVKTAK